jgi:hypothetical protein
VKEPILGSAMSPKGLFLAPTPLKRRLKHGWPTGSHRRASNPVYQLLFPRPRRRRFLYKTSWCSNFSIIDIKHSATYKALPAYIKPTWLRAVSALPSAWLNAPVTEEVFEGKNDYMRRLQGWALSNRVGRERKPAPVKRPPDGPSVPQTGQASPAQTGAALRDGGCRALVYIFDPSPQLRVHISKTLTATSFTRILCCFCHLNAWQTCCALGLAFLASPLSKRSQNQSPELG